jgi:uncharacterized membrane protein
MRLRTHHFVAIIATLSLLLLCVNADVYLHTPRGGNNRLVSLSYAISDLCHYINGNVAYRACMLYVCG